MRSPSLFLLLTSVLAGSASAQANSERSAVAVDGTVAGLCILGPPSRPSIDLGTLVALSGSRAGRIRVIGAQQISLPGSFCNFAGTALTVSASAMRTQAIVNVEPGFSRAINYTSTVANWAAQHAAATTGATAQGQSASSAGTGGTQPLPKVADLEVTLSGFLTPGDALLVADDYEGTVTITLGPSVAAD